MSEAVEVEVMMPDVEDATALLAYAKRIGSETEYLEFGAEGLSATLRDEELYLQAVAMSDEHMMLVAKMEGEIIAVGTISGRMKSKFAHVGEVGISVLKEYWGQGLGSHLLAELLFWAQTYSPLTRIELEVVKDNVPAIRLYEKLGFVHEGVKRQAIQLSDGLHDIVMMSVLFEKETI